MRERERERSESGSMIELRVWDRVSHCYQRGKKETFRLKTITCFACGSWGPIATRIF